MANQFHCNMQIYPYEISFTKSSSVFSGQEVLSPGPGAFCHGLAIVLGVHNNASFFINDSESAQLDKAQI